LLILIIIFLRRFIVEILGKILKNTWPEVDDQRMAEELFDLLVRVLIEDASKQKHPFLTELLVDNLGFFSVSIFLRLGINRFTKSRLQKHRSGPYLIRREYYRLLCFIQTSLITAISSLSHLLVKKFFGLFIPFVELFFLSIPLVAATFVCRTPLVKPNAESLAHASQELLISDVHLAFGFDTQLD
jgi:hypothetical protein